MFAPKPAAVREYMLEKINPSMWRYANSMVVGGVLIVCGAIVLGETLPEKPEDVAGGICADGARSDCNR